MPQKVLIIGAGLAGICLAHRLLEAGAHVTMMDAGQNHSSAVAAGMVNPMVFRRMNKSWRLAEFLKEGSDFYQQIEKRTGGQFYHPLVIRRFFSSQQEKDLWDEKSNDQSYEPYLEKIIQEDTLNQSAHNLFGSGRVKAAFWVHAANWLKENWRYFTDQGILIKEVFKAQKWEAESKHYDGIQYDAVAFCMGYLQKNEATFGYLPLQQTKGQILTIESSQISQKESLNRKCFVLPVGENLFRVGATYEWNNSSLHTTQEAKQTLIENLNALGSFDYQIREQIAGVRPTVLDRRPLMGEHPKLQGVFIFNGLGTKGYMMAPTLARELAAHILDSKGLHPETCISRFNDLLLN
jgi:glycine oxidase